MGLAAWGEECGGAWGGGGRRGIAQEGAFPALTQIREGSDIRVEAKPARS